MRAPTRTGAAITAWGLALFCLLAVTLAVVLCCSDACQAGPEHGDTAGFRAGDMPPDETGQPPGPVKDMGSLPGPSTWGQTAVGILLPGLIGLGIALILNQSGSRAGAPLSSPAAPAVSPAVSGAGAESALPPGSPPQGAHAPPQTDAPPGRSAGSQETAMGWDPDRAGRAGASMERALYRLGESADADEPVDVVSAGEGRAGLAKVFGVEAVNVGGVARALLDRTASRIAEDEGLRRREHPETPPAYSDTLQGLEVSDGHIERELSETKQALSRTERIMARLDASSGKTGAGVAPPGRLEGGIQAHEAAGIGGELLGQVDEAGKEYLEYLALRRDLELKEAVFEYRRKRSEKGDEQA